MHSDTLSPRLEGAGSSTVRRRAPAARGPVLSISHGTPDKSRLGGNAIYSVSLAVAQAAAVPLSGSVPRTGERTAGQNRLLRIEEELGASATFATLESWL